MNDKLGRRVCDLFVGDISAILTQYGIENKAGGVYSYPDSHVKWCIVCPKICSTTIAYVSGRVLIGSTIIWSSRPTRQLRQLKSMYPQCRLAFKKCDSGWCLHFSEPGSIQLSYLIDSIMCVRGLLS